MQATANAPDVTQQAPDDVAVTIDQEGSPESNFLEDFFVKVGCLSPYYCSTSDYQHQSWMQ